MKAVGLYDPAYEHDACGVAFVARLDGVASHETVVRALTALANLEHRGAEGADAVTGDGAGMTLQVPDALFRAELGAALPPLGSYGVAVCFLPRDAGARGARSSGSWPRRSRRRDRGSSRGATSRSTSATRAPRRPRPRRASGSSSSPPRRDSRRTTSSASST